MEAVTETRPAKRLSAGTSYWSALPLDILLLVFANLGAVDILVSHSWLQAAKMPDLWRSVDMANHKELEKVSCA
jgi:hypothetical protein